MAISRSRVLVFTALALLAFDAGRSLWARFGYAYPRARWKPDPAEFAGIAWPPGADAPDGLPLGQRIYLRSCQTCHGPDGRGNGPAAPSMSPRPRDFTQGQLKYKSTAAEVPPTDGDLLSAEEIKARNLVSGLQYIADPAHASVEDLRRELVALRTQLEQAIANRSSVGRPFTVKAAPPATVSMAARATRTKNHLAGRSSLVT